MLRLDDLQVFVQTAEAGSFPAATGQMDLTPSLASSCIQRLERELDARLFVRSTRRLRLSDADVVRRCKNCGSSCSPAARTGCQRLWPGNSDISKYFDNPSNARPIFRSAPLFAQWSHFIERARHPYASGSRKHRHAGPRQDSSLFY
ncbi:LysR family transcriptional regulator [Pseudomonas gingeri]|uniref:LysR family transcriptional regulator n=1 Tax=Pseudomonas gingeri TaxID=117681 RepID=A0A7Y8C302_9PSED|nr:LysR family transcriptional regulator [Pseudomonas gingeri]NWB97144.1 LysR family transcriptional regulator [Pseudomonas gingeri]